jgi:hypothetical protein
MNLTIKNSVLTLLLVILISSCDKDKPKAHHNCQAPITIDLNAVVATSPLELQNALYTDYLGRNYKVELLKFYLSNWALEKSNGERVSIDGINLIDFSSDEKLNIEAEVDTGIYINLHFGIGLDALTNSSDPAEFESSHPLSISQNTYWTWASKYKFFMLEGRVDTLEGTNPDVAFSYHTGFDNLYREVSIPLNNLLIDSSGDSLHLELDVDKLLNGNYGTIDFLSTPFSHTLDEVTEMISNNLVSSFSIY